MKSWPQWTRRGAMDRSGRESLTDYYFQRRFFGMSFSVADFRKACDVFDDVIAKKTNSSRAKEELDQTEEFLQGELPSKEKCRAIWQMITVALPHPKK